MLFTRWKNLGPGPENKVWKQHLPLRFAENLARAIMAKQLSAQAPTGIRAQAEGQLQGGDLSSAFGDGDDFKFDSLLTSANMAELFRVQKKCIAKQE